jgi:glycylpeptide N-tetradecanoyltransferase
MPPPAEESKPVEPVVVDVDAKLKDKQAEVESEGEEEDDEPAAEGAAPGAGSSKKKKSKRKKAKALLTGKSGDQEADLKKALGGLNPQQLKELMSLNPGLAQEVAQASGSANPSAEQAAEQLKKMDLNDIMTGLAASGKNVKDMGAYKFWQTQPVPRFTDDAKLEEGPIKVQTVDQISTEPAGLVEGFEWVTMDLSNDDEVKEVYELLNGHYVEDDEAMFRFNYSPSFLRWYVLSYRSD